MEKFRGHRLIHWVEYNFKRFFGRLHRTDFTFLITRAPMIVSPNLGNPVIVNPLTDPFFEITLACMRRYSQKIVEKLVRGHLYLQNSRTMKKYLAKVISVSPHPVGKSSYLANLARRNIYGLRDRFFRVRIATPRFKIAPPRTFELFDITYVNPNGNPHTVFHALSVTNQAWTNFDFIQISDIHVAKRNDAIFDTIARKKFLQVDFDQPIDAFFEAADPEIFTNPKMRGLVEFLEFRNRANNFNSALRQFISYANLLASEGKIDFVLMTGDLVDFVRISVFPSGLGTERSNFQLLHDFLIGKYVSPPLLVPCFMVPGNHDYRMNHYKLSGMTSLDFAAEYKSFGLTRGESQLFKQVGTFNPLASSSSGLVDYHRYLNPKLDFFKRFGNFHFLFYNSGPDVFFGENSFVDIIGGEPDAQGFLDEQLAWFQEYMAKRVKPRDKVCVVFHTPPINFSKQSDIEEILEATRVQRGVTPWISDRRLDVGAISRNRSKFLLAALGQGLPQPVDLVITGHVHRPAEYRLELTGVESAEEEEQKYRVYCGRYSQLLAQAGGDPARVREFWAKHRPLLVNSCALGPINCNVQEGRVPGYRVFSVRNGEFVGCAQEYRHHHPYFFLSRSRNVLLSVPWRSTIGENWQDFRGKVDVEVFNPEGISSSMTYFEVEIKFHGRGLRGYDVKPRLAVKQKFAGGKVMQSPVLGSSKKVYKRFFVMQNAQHFVWSFAGQCRYGRTPLSALTGVRLTVRVIAVVRKAGEWRVIGDEETSNKVGLSY